MPYHQLMQKLYSVILFSGMKLGLKNCEHLNQLLDFPTQKYASIHVAGTNGKGSVTHKIASALQHAGYRVGQYTSPHISCFRERIRINQEMISEEAVESGLNELFAIIEEQQIPTTFFELTTFLAFCHFAKEKVDFAVIETGLGGRLDATNIILPKLSIITSISVDHAEILGNSLEEITYEKAGIIKPKIPILTGPRVPFDQIETVAKKMQSRHIHLSDSYPNFEAENCAIARKALDFFSVDELAIEKGLNSHLPCRLQTFTKEQLCLSEEKPFPQKIILDVAHNPDGLRHLFEAIREQEPACSIRVLFGLSKTKDVSSCLSILKEQCDDFHLVEPRNERGNPPEALKTVLLNLGVPKEHIFITPTIAASVNEALFQAAVNQQLLIICGSFFIMGEVRQALGIQEAHDTFDMN